MKKYIAVKSDIITEFEIVKDFNLHNVIKERIDIYKDFSTNLLYYIYDTYLGKEYIYTQEDIKGHFNWCFNKVVNEFLEEEIDFRGNDEIYSYFYGYYLIQFYANTSQHPISFHEKFWNEIFSFSKGSKKRRDFDLFLELYNMFDKSINNKFKNIEIF